MTVMESDIVKEEIYSLNLEEIYQKLQTNPKNGLTKEEAENRLKLHGFNEIPKVSKGFIKIYLAPLFNWLIVIYLIGALILFLASLFGEEGQLTFIILTLGIVGLNCLIAIFQQYRATKKLKALRELSAPTTTVIRDNQKRDIPTKNVVVGDILVLSQGDKIPADARIIKSVNLELNEASLTGESEPVKKQEIGTALEKKEISIGARKNMVFYGTYITTGNGTAITTSTGVHTEIGKISRGLEEAGTSDIPIRKKMNNFGKWLGLAVLVFWFIVLMIFWVASGFKNNLEITKSLNSAMDIMPINIPLLTTIVLLTGVLAMAHHGVIIRNLASVDSLGRVSVVCSDKTGTLTKNQMSVEYVWVDDQTYIVSGKGYDPDGDIFLIKDSKNKEIVTHIENYPQLKQLLISGFLNNNSALVKNEIIVDGKTIDNWNVVGSPTEGALMVLYQKGMGDIILEDFEHIREFPFDSTVKRMTKLYRKDSVYYSFTKGASEILIPFCTKILTKDGIMQFTDDYRKKVEDNVNNFAEKGYRILSLCYKEMNHVPPNIETEREICESEMIYLGFVTILDPPREGVRESVEQCHNAGVDVIMITGDSPTTAKAIAKQISIISSEDNVVIEGKDIKYFQTFSEFSKIKVFARVSPQHKQEIIERYQNEGRVVAMTGDGVNDALALNMADAGIAMGIQGTDVAKEASDMVISDDSFNSIVKGIHQGRGIFAKIRAVVFFYICINLFEGLVQFLLAVVFNLPYFLDEEFYWQWIFLSITLHAFPGLILTFDIISKDVMNEKPRDSEEILSRNTVKLMLCYGILLALSMIITYFIVMLGIYPVYPENHNFGAYNNGYLYSQKTKELTSGVNLRVAKALTMLMVTLFFCESFLIYQIRRPNKNLIKSFKEDSSKAMYLVILLLFGIFLALMYIPGVQVSLAKIGINFMFMFLTAFDWLVCFLISLICIISFEIVKLIARRKNISF